MQADVPGAYAAGSKSINNSSEAPQYAKNTEDCAPKTRTLDEKATTATGKSPPMPRRTLPSGAPPDHSIEMSLLGSCDKGHCPLPNAGARRHLHASALQLTHR